VIVIHSVYLLLNIYYKSIHSNWSQFTFCWTLYSWSLSFTKDFLIAKTIFWELNCKNLLKFNSPPLELSQIRFHTPWTMTLHQWPCPLWSYHVHFHQDSHLHHMSKWWWSSHAMEVKELKVTQMEIGQMELFGWWLRRKEDLNGGLVKGDLR